MLKQCEELSVLEQGDDGAIVAIRGQGGLSVLLSEDYLAHLEHVLKRAEAEMPGAFRQSDLGLLCSEIGTLVATYNEARNKFYGAPVPAKTLAAAMEELEEMRRLLNAT